MASISASISAADLIGGSSADRNGSPWVGVEAAVFVALVLPAVEEGKSPSLPLDVRWSRSLSLIALLIR